MTVNETRKKNLRAIIEKQGGVSKLARLMGYSNPSFLSQMAGPRPTREITEKSARKLESAMGLPAGALDRDKTVYPGGEANSIPPEAGAAPAPARQTPGTAPALQGSAALVAEVVRLVGGAKPTEEKARMLARLLK